MSEQQFGAAVAGAKEQCVSIGSQAFVQDASSGAIKTFVGSCQCDPGTQDRPVVFNPSTRTFPPVADLAQAIKACPFAPQGEYLILSNPVRGIQELTVEKILEAQPDSGGGKVMTPQGLTYGQDLILPGPVMLPVWPGQHTRRVKGHSLLSNEFLTVRITDPVLARQYWQEIVTEKAEGESDDNAAQEGEAGIGEARKFRMGELIIVQGDQYSFFIPCHGAEVVPWYTMEDTEKKTPLYIRPACTLQNLQYCILQDENGTEDYVYGPQVVFPKSTERFWTDADGRRKFEFVELIDKNCGIHLKVVSEFTEGGGDGDDGTTYGVGDELWITGENTPIFKPRKQLRCIEYGEGNQLHFGTLVPEEQGRYILDKEAGVIEIREGGQIIICDPRTETIVRRPLTNDQCDLWYPGNEAVKAYNRKLREAESEEGKGVSEVAFATATGQPPSPTVRKRRLPSTQKGALETLGAGMPTRDMSDALSRPEGATTWEDQRYLDAEEEAAQTESTGGAGSVPGAFKRRTTHTPPRAITIGSGDDPYAGVPRILPWSKNTVQVVKANGERETKVDGAAYLMGFTEDLQALCLSQDTPKGVNAAKKRTVYLQYENNRVKDQFEAITADGVKVTIAVDYRIDFDIEQKDKWFDVIDYVELAYVRMRSVLTTAVRTVDIETFYGRGQEMIRDFVLGFPGAEKVGDPAPELPEEDEVGAKPPRPGFPFADNGMCITDCDVQPLELEDKELQEKLDDLQQQIIESNVAIAASTKNLAATTELEDLKRQLLAQRDKTAVAENDLALANLQRELQQAVARVESTQAEEEARLQIITAQQAILDKEAAAELARTKAESDQALAAKETENGLAKAMLEAETAASTAIAASFKDGLGEIAAALSDGRNMEVLAQAFNVQGGVAAIMEAINGGNPDGIIGLAKKVLGGSSHEQLDKLAQRLHQRQAHIDNLAEVEH